MTNSYLSEGLVYHQPKHQMLTATAISRRSPPFLLLPGRSTSLRGLGGWRCAGSSLVSSPRFALQAARCSPRFSLIFRWQIHDGFTLYMRVFMNGVPPKLMVYNGKAHESGWFGGTPISGIPHVLYEWYPLISPTDVRVGEMYYLGKFDDDLTWRPHHRWWM